MKVIENKFKENKEEIKNKKESERITCEYCDSIFEFSDEDIVYRQLGIGTVECPCCKRINELENYEIKLTIDNIEFPIHFDHTSTENGASDISAEDIIAYIREGIAFFRRNKDEFAWEIACGNMHISMFRYDGDEEYQVVVTKDYYETYIDFEDADYADNDVKYKDKTGSVGTGDNKKIDCLHDIPAENILIDGMNINEYLRKINGSASINW